MKKILRKIKIKIEFLFKPKISIIIPIYNCESYLNECLDSLINQSLKNIEIICVDDESTDKSYSIIEEYARKDKRIKLFKQEHSNAGNARNLGISKAKGKYLLFLDSDDFFNKDLCKKAFNNAYKNKNDILFFMAKKYNNIDKTFYPFNFMVNKGFYPEDKNIFSALDNKDKLFQLTSSAPWSKLFERKFVLDNHLYFQSCQNSNDVFFTKTAMLCGKRMSVIKNVLVYYRVNQNTNTQSNKDKNPLFFYEAYKMLLKFMLDNNLLETYYKTYLNSFMSDLLYNYETLKTDEAKKILINTINNNGLKKLQIKKFKKTDFYNDKFYDKYIEYFKNAKD